MQWETGSPLWAFSPQKGLLEGRIGIRPLKQTSSGIPISWPIRYQCMPAKLALIASFRHNMLQHSSKPMLLQKQYYVECLLTAGLISKAQLTEELWAILADSRLPEAVVINALSLMMTRRRRILHPAEDVRKLVLELLPDQKAMQDATRCTQVFALLL